MIIVKAEWRGLAMGLMVCWGCRGYRAWILGGGEPKRGDAAGQGSTGGSMNGDSEKPTPGEPQTVKFERPRRPIKSTSTPAPPPTHTHRYIYTQTDTHTHTHIHTHIPDGDGLSKGFRKH